jgi:hypothetical protein
VKAIAERQPGDTLTLTVAEPGEAETQEVIVTLGEDPDEAGKAYLGVHLGGFFHIDRSKDGARFDKDIELFLEPEAMFDDLPFDFEMEAVPLDHFEFDTVPEFHFDFDEFEFEWCGEGGSCFDNSI